MNFLINCSNLKVGGGIQVAQSVLEEIKRYTEHHFIAVVSEYINISAISFGNNTELFVHNIKHNFRTVALCRDNYLDNLVKEKKVDAVITLFGPSLWRPKVPHLCGFARAQLLLNNPLSNKITLKKWLLYKVWEWGFKKSGDTFYTENGYISEMLPRLLGNVKVYTVTNYYNQIFDQPEKWKRSVHIDDDINETNKVMVTMLTVSSNASHKNLCIMVPVAKYLEQKYPDFQFRFVLTCEDSPFELPENMFKHFVFIGKVDVSECPNLYEQADIMFMPTLMECFTATYPEAMRMKVPIVTTDLEFARGLCGEAACYYSAIDPVAAAEAIHKVATDKKYARQLIENGQKQLLKYDNYEQRTKKLIDILEEISKQ